MDTVLIFFPINIIHGPSGYLVGFFKEEKSHTLSIYIIESGPVCSSSKNQGNIFKPFSLIGYCSTNFGKSKFAPKSHSEKVWIHAKCDNSEIVLDSCLINFKSKALNDCLVVLYDVDSFNHSELLLHPNNLFENDHFRTIATSLQLRRCVQKNNSFKLLELPIKCSISVFGAVCDILTKCSFVVKYSTLALHLKNFSHSIVWICQTYQKNRSVNVKVGNSLISIFIDILAGFLVYYTITSWKNAGEIFETLSFCTETVIDTINQLVEWLMGSPAGLKLNQPLSSLLGSLVFYYLEIWRSFLRVVRPLLEVSFFILIKLGFLGLTFQLAVCTDIFAIISFHVYCIYVYAARLYEIQAKGICSLSRLVLGRKRNPEPGKVDSCPYSTEELLIGTISFAVLLFLLPTTLIYYIVFTLMRIGVILTRGLMTRTIYLMQILPLYSTLLWGFFPCYTATTVKVSPLTTSQSGHGSLVAELTSSSWIDTTKHCIPDAVPAPKPIPFGETISKIVLGKLI